jgi:aldehyde:ferredoxin oxidoreductase
MAGGYWGRIALLDLGGGKVETLPFEEDLQQAVIGGCGLGAHLLHEYLDFDAPPLAPQNPLIFATGPLTGVGIPTASRYEVVARSPLTGLYGQADSGGSWGDELKRSGWDALVIVGQAAAPQYVWIEDGQIELRSAQAHWGLDCYEVEAPLRDETDGRAVVLSIGPAGERGCPLAAIMNDGPVGRAAARCGLGAVMGAKRLKAVVVRGSQHPSVEHPKVLRQFASQLAGTMVEHRTGLHEYGTLGGILAHEKFGGLPIKNWQLGSWEEEVQQVSGQTLAKSALTGKYGCRGCVIQCGREVAARYGPMAGQKSGGPEYETTAMLGPNCLVDDLEVIIRANELCNRYGLDTISTGAAIAFGMEAYEKGLITRADTDGLALEWGSGEALLGAIEVIAKGEGIGRLLGQGTRRAAQELGHGAEAFAVEVKGLDYPAHDGRAYNSAALGYATATRGACHLEAISHVVERSVPIAELGFPKVLDRFSTEYKGELVARLQNLMCMYDSLKLCKMIWFTGVRVDDMVRLLNLVTGWELSQSEFLRCGERIFNLKKLINLRLGATRGDDTVPYRIRCEPRGSGSAADNLPPLEPMLEDYYRYRGWDSEGRPTPSRIKKLGLEEYD